MTAVATDTELEARPRAMWASGDYPRMVDTFLLPLGPRLVDACDIAAGARVLDVAAGTGNASLPAAARGALVTASDLTPELLADGRRRAEAEGLDLEWAEADAEHLPFDDGSFDVVMSTIGVMFAPPPPPGAQPPPLWGSAEHLTALFGGRVEFSTLRREPLEITAFEDPHDYARHFSAYYGPRSPPGRTPSARAVRSRERETLRNGVALPIAEGLTSSPRSCRPRNRRARGTSPSLRRGRE